MKHAICDNCGTFYDVPQGPDFPVYQYRLYCGWSCVPTSRKIADRRQKIRRERKKFPKGFFVWRNMVARCHDRSHKDYRHYGARGIYVCPQWRNSFEQFRRDMGDPPVGLTLDRKDNDGPYRLDNCIWSTRSEQNRNKRSNVRITYGDRTQLLIDWCRELSLNYSRVRQRISSLGWTVERAFTEPPQIRKSSPGREAAL